VREKGTPWANISAAFFGSYETVKTKERIDIVFANAGVIAFLASERAPWTSGASIPVDGGSGC